MVNANCTITVLNGILDRESRRSVFLPTCIQGVTWCEADAVEGKTGAFSGARQVAIRIPLSAAIENGKQFIHHSLFKQMTAEKASRYWTLKNEDVVLRGAIHEDGPIYNALIDLQKYGQTIQITSFSDNTERGSPAVRHWRIGGV